jgi:tRNA uridine 5-carboxymethylaminomethyl modification enzyme
VRSLLERRPNLQLAQGTVAGLAVEQGEVRGVETEDGRRYSAAAVVLTAGTFLRGVIHLGLDVRLPAGRAGDAPAVELAQVIESLGVTVQRFKTGTPPRIDGNSVDLTRLSRQDGDANHYWFSFYERVMHPRQLPCYLTWTSDHLRDIRASLLSQSALYGGAIAGRGPRYCPSIEDKIV